jgi:4-hydroxyacetophenone monooxygenase
VTELLRMTIERGCRTAACRQAAHDEYVSWVDVANAESAWGVADIPTWYRNEDGRSAQNWPYSLGSYWARTRAPNPEHFDFGP